MNITIPGWMIPTLITIITCIYSIIYDGGGMFMFSGLSNILLLLLSLVISLTSWIVYLVYIIYQLH